MKYIDAEKLKAEIERLKATNPSEYNYQNAEGYVWALYDILSFLGTIEEEPVGDGLEEAAEKHINEALFKWSYDDEDGIEQYVHDSFIAGANWQYQKDRGEFVKIKAKTWCEGFDACKEQMLKEAVEGQIYGSDGSHWVESGIEENLTGKEGDAVKLIIVKIEKYD